MERKPTQPLELFYCYAREDHTLRDQLDEHLATLRRTGLITAWYDGEIVPGVSWEEEIETHLNTADIILLLISSAFILSDYCYSNEMQRALERHHAKKHESCQSFYVLSIGLVHLLAPSKCYPSMLDL